MATTDWGSIYKELGATPVINATGSVTMLGGSTPAPEVKEAMERAEGAYIPLMELEEKAGQAIADMASVEAAYITSGAGSALTLATAALMAGDDDDKIQQLPDTTGMKNEILMQRNNSSGYTKCHEYAGATLTYAGNESGATQDQLADAITDDTAAILHTFAYGPPRPGLTLPETVEVARNVRNPLPVIVDGAAMLPPKENLTKYISEGADLVTFRM